jgi:hypothetical protein
MVAIPVEQSGESAYKVADIAMVSHRASAGRGSGRARCILPVMSAGSTFATANRSLFRQPLTSPRARIVFFAEGWPSGFKAAVLKTAVGDRASCLWLSLRASELSWPRRRPQGPRTAKPAPIRGPQKRRRPRIGVPQSEPFQSRLWNI